MSFLKKVKVSDKASGAGLDDRIGGRRILDSNIYTGEISVAYLGESTGGAPFVHFEVDLTDGSKYNETIYIGNTNGETWYTDKQTNKQVTMKGFNIVNAILLLATGADLMEQEIEERTFKIWDSKESKQVDKAVECPVQALGAKISLGILKTIKNKSAKGDDGLYHDTNEKQEENSIEAVFDAEDKYTVKEALAANETGEDIAAVHYDVWLKANEGRVVDKFKEVKAGGTKGKLQKPTQAGKADEPVKKLGMFKKPA